MGRGRGVKDRGAGGAGGLGQGGQGRPCGEVMFHRGHRLQGRRLMCTAGWMLAPCAGGRWAGEGKRQGWGAGKTTKGCVFVSWGCGNSPTDGVAYTAGIYFLTGLEAEVELCRGCGQSLLTSLHVGLQTMAPLCLSSRSPPLWVCPPFLLSLSRHLPLDLGPIQLTQWDLISRSLT